MTVGGQSGILQQGHTSPWRGGPLGCAFSGRYLTTSLYHTADWCAIDVEQNLSEAWADDTDVVQSCLLVY